jgi:signal transduction histidine kinase
MKLRQRIGLITLAATAPMVGGLVWLDVRAQQTAAEAELAELVVAPTELPGELERCSADGESWSVAPNLRRVLGDARSTPSREPGESGPAWVSRDGARRSQRLGPAGPHRLPARFFVYDAALRARTHDAPELAADAASEPLPVLSRSSIWQGDRVEVLVRTPWPGTPCSYVLARGTTEPWLGALLPPTRIWALPALVVFATVLLSIGPIVQRVRRLTSAVQRTAALGYQRPLQDATQAAIDWGNDEVAELARAFDHAGEQVRTLLAEKDRRERALREFVADTTHDVAIPLTVLQGHLTTLRDGLAANAPLDRTALASAMDEAHYIGALLHNLGAAAKLDAEEMSLQRGEVEPRRARDARRRPAPADRAPTRSLDRRGDPRSSPPDASRRDAARTSREQRGLQRSSTQPRARPRRGAAIRVSGRSTLRHPRTRRWPGRRSRIARTPRRTRVSH